MGTMTSLCVTRPQSGVHQYRPPLSRKLIATPRFRSGRREHRNEVVQRLADIAFQRGGDDHADGPEQRRAAEVHVEADHRVVVVGALWFNLGDQLDLDPTDAFTVE